MLPLVVEIDHSDSQWLQRRSRRWEKNRKRFFAMSVRSIIVSEIHKIAVAQKRDLATFHDDLPLMETGFDSLCFAVLVAQLEDDLGIDPFSSAEEIEFPVTLGDFIALYENAASR
jgi:acyl carrier protein